MYTIAVLMGSKEEFDFFINEHKHPEYNYIYVGRAEDVLGRRFVGMIIDGTFWERPDATQLHREVIMSIK